MTYRVVIQPRAERDIQEAVRRLRERSRSAAPALRWVYGLPRKIAALRDKARRCPLDPGSDTYGEEVRVLPYRSQREVYRVLFAMRSDVVHVLTIRRAPGPRTRDNIAE